MDRILLNNDVRCLQSNSFMLTIVPLESERDKLRNKYETEGYVSIIDYYPQVPPNLF